MSAVLDNRRDALLLALLPNIAFDGWTRRALREAADRAGIDPIEIATLFPGGVRDAVAWFSHWADRQTLEILKHRRLGTMKIRARIAAGVMTRLTILAPHREAVRRSLALLASPRNLPLGAKLLYDTVDALWHAAGDRATDFNFYTKRGLLAAVYTATTLYWLEDRSEGSEATAAFLDRRLAEVLSIPRLRAQLDRFNPWRVFAAARERFSAAE